MYILDKQVYQTWPAASCDNIMVQFYLFTAGTQ